MATVQVETSTELTAAIKTGGKTIEIAPRNYSLKNLTIGKSDTELVSASDTAIPYIYMAANHPSVPMLNGYNLDGIRFDRVCLDGNFSNQPGAVRGSSSLVLCWLRNGEDIAMQNCIMRNSAIDGLKLTACDGILFENNTISDLGHEGLYAMYGCENGIVRNNKVKTRTNSAFRLSYGATDFKIYNNDVYSVIDKTSTGPGMELDKRAFKDIEIYNNNIRNMNGSGIWFSADISTCSNVNIHDNVFDNVGNFLNGDFDYNGYSNAGIAGAGMSGMVIENNTFQNINIGYAILMAEAKHALSGSYKWIFRNNTLKNCKYGIRISNSRGSISGGGNTFTKVGTLKYGVTANINVTAAEDTTPEPDPVDNTTPTTEDIKVDVTVTDASGKTGSQSIVLSTTAQSARSNGLSLATFKLSSNGLYGTKNIEFKPSVETTLANTCTGTNWLVKLALTRSDKKVSTIQFIAPTIKGTGSNEIKIRTSDGMYGAGALAIVLNEPEIIEEPVTNDDDTNDEVITVAKQTKYTLNLVDFEGNALKVNSAADVQVATKQDGNLIKGYVVFTTASGYTTGRIPISAPMIKQ